MFTGIIKTIGTVEKLEQEGTNLHLTFSSEMTSSLAIDQSVSHNGVCLTIVSIDGDQYTVTAIEETLRLTNLGTLTVGDKVNLEKAMTANALLDGHIIQGHIDTTCVCTNIVNRDGSWHFHFEYNPSPEHLLVNKGSICINGVSLTVVEPVGNVFSVAIIPYTYEHTTFKFLKPGDKVNLEFDIIGKYIGKYFQVYREALL